MCQQLRHTKGTGGKIAWTRPQLAFLPDSTSEQLPTGRERMTKLCTRFRNIWACWSLPCASVDPLGCRHSKWHALAQFRCFVAKLKSPTQSDIHSSSCCFQVMDCKGGVAFSLILAMCSAVWSCANHYDKVGSLIDTIVYMSIRAQLSNAPQSYFLKW